MLLVLLSASCECSKARWLLDALGAAMTMCSFPPPAHLLQQHDDIFVQAAADREEMRCCHQDQKMH